MSGLTAKNRLVQIKDFVTGNKTATSIPWDPDCTVFPLRNDLPRIDGTPEGAAWVWGKDDNVGRLNLLTPTRVKAAASEIQTGEMVRLDLPLDEPKTPAFGREEFKHEIKTLKDGVVYDDLYVLNTQSGSQFDGFRHFAHVPSMTFYNNTTGEDIKGPNANDRCSVHHWSTHGFTGRAVLLDYWTYAQTTGKIYDPYTAHSISFSELVACGKDQGIDIRPTSQGGDIKIGDILLIRSGFIDTYYKTPPSEARRLAIRDHGINTTTNDPSDPLEFAGIEQSQEMLTWLHDCYFSAVGGDAPAFETWPTKKDYHLHEYILALWGMPLGEMIDLEKVSQLCRDKGRWTFFFTSATANCRGGVGTHPNATAIF